MHNLSEEGISDLVASLSLSKFIKRVFPDKPVRIDLSHMQFGIWSCLSRASQWSLLFYFCSIFLGKPLRNPDKQAVSLVA